MDLGTALRNMVKGERRARFVASDQLALGDLIDGLAAVDDASKTVWYDFADARPTTIHSWRGSYDELALGFAFAGDAPTVGALLAELRGAVGTTFQGYKGGDFVMDAGTPVWVANWGSAGDTAIVGVRDVGYAVVIETAYREF